MQRKQLAALFVINLVPFTVGNGLLPHLPGYLVEMGGNEAAAGLYLALAFAALFCGTLFAGWVTQRVSANIQIRRTIILIAASIAAPSLILMRQATTPITLTVLMSIVWFTGGLRNASVSTLAGMYADPTQRGRVFGILGMSAGVGAIIGGVAGGYLTENHGLGSLFLALGFAEMISVIAGLFVEDRAITKKPEIITKQSDADIGLTFWLLFLAAWMVATLHFSAGLGRPLKMHHLDFGAADIASTATAIGITNLIVPYLVGYLSDRLQRQLLMIFCYSAYAIGSLVLAYASNLWHFWLNAALFSIGWAAMNVGAAFITDLVSPHALDKAMSRYMSAPWVGGVLGFATAGFVIETLDIRTTFIVATTFPILAIILILTIKDKKQTQITETQPMPVVSGD